MKPVSFTCIEDKFKVFFGDNYDFRIHKAELVFPRELYEKFFNSDWKKVREWLEKSDLVIL